MIMVMSRKKLIVFTCLLVLCAGLTGAAYQIYSSRSAFLPNEGKTIIIDAGHAAQCEYHMAANPTFLS